MRVEVGDRVRLFDGTEAAIVSVADDGETVVVRGRDERLLTLPVWQLMLVAQSPPEHDPRD